MSKIGIIGGTFNPVHIGHLYLAEVCLDEIKLDEVWFMPTGCSYMKDEQDIVSAKDRLEMLKLAVEGNPRVKVSDIEVLREGYTYTFETLEYLRTEFPKDEFYLIYGTDCLYQIEKWKNPHLIFKYAHLYIAVRGNADVSAMEDKAKELQVKFGADIQIIPYLNLDVSSTFLREKIKKSESIKYLVPDKVIDYITENEFYK